MIFRPFAYLFGLSGKERAYLYYPDRRDFCEMAAQYDVVPVWAEFMADTITPISIFSRFADRHGSFLLESVEGGTKWGRYSFIGINPSASFEFKNGLLKTDAGQVPCSDPIAYMKDWMHRRRCPQIKDLPRFSGGCAGYFAYDIVRVLEPLPDMPEDDLELPDAHFVSCDDLIVYDHLKQRIIIITNVNVEHEDDAAYERAIGKIKLMYDEIMSQQASAAVELHKSTDDISPISNVSRQQYIEWVERAKQYILDGDIFQVVLSQRYETVTDAHPFDVYRALRTLNPSPYMYYFNFGYYRIAGSSPESLVRVEDGIVETCPIAGTRPRGDTPEQDVELENELLNDEKERAEHIMLVDLGRNDIGKVAEYGSVRVENIMHIEKYSHVMHLVTNVKGRLKGDNDAFDALAACLPAGTVSGAPKVRAMQIIDEMEQVRRGPYAGAIGYIGYNGNMDVCITIRTAIFVGEKVYVQAGAGIVADSVPEREYVETGNKAKALLQAIASVEKRGVLMR
jgi:anthranilate synthase component 1